MFEQEVIKKILDFAIWAPSGDNSQPWRFTVCKDAIKVIYVPNQDNPFYNFKRNASHIACGCLIENISIASSQLGYASKIKLFPNNSSQDVVAEITLEKASIILDPLFEFIKTRHTNRKPYKKERLNNSHKNQILNVAQEIGNGNVLIAEDQEEIKNMSFAASTNEIIVLENKELHDAFFSEIIWNEEENINKKVGLYLKTLELKPPQRIGFKLYKSWFFARIFNRLGMSRFIANEDAKIYCNSSAIGVVTVNGFEPEDYILAGRIIQRIWLKTTQLGLSLQPITGLIFLMRKIQGGDRWNLSKTHIEAIENSYKIIERIFEASGKNIATMFRIGVGDTASARCLRKPPEIYFEK